MPGDEAERHAPRPQLDGAVGRPHVRKVVAGVGETEVPGGRLEHAVEAGDEHLRRHVRAEVLVDPLEDDAGVDEPLAEARSTLRVAAMTSAAGTPLSVTSPMTKPTWPSGSGMKS